MRQEQEVLELKEPYIIRMLDLTIKENMSNPVLVEGEHDVSALRELGLFSSASTVTSYQNSGRGNFPMNCRNSLQSQIPHCQFLT